MNCLNDSSILVEFCSAIQFVDIVENGDIFPRLPQIEYIPVCN